MVSNYFLRVHTINYQIYLRTLFFAETKIQVVFILQVLGQNFKINELLYFSFINELLKFKLIIHSLFQFYKKILIQIFITNYFLQFFTIFYT